MSATDTAAAIACPRCHAGNAAGARFCLACGAPLQAGAANGGGYAPSPPPLPPEPPTAAPTGFLGASGGAGTGNGAQTVVPMPLTAAHAAVLGAIQSTGATVRSQQSPYAILYETTRRSFWSTGGVRVTHEGQVRLSPMGPHQTAVAVSLKLAGSSQTGIIVSYGIATVVGLFFWQLFGLVLGVAGLAWMLYRESSQLPKELAETLTRALAEQPAPRAVMHMGAPVGTRPGTPAAPSDGRPALEQLKQLAQLRDLGVITAAEFDAKKAELLKRL